MRRKTERAINQRLSVERPACSDYHDCMMQLGKIMIYVGLAAVCIGAVLYLLSRAGVTRLPGDVSFGGRNWRVYLPIGTSILLSLVLTLILYILSRLRK